MADLNFSISGNSIQVTLGGGTGIISVGFKRDNFTTDGVTTYFDLSYAPIADSLLVFWNGILQKYGTDYTLSGKRITPATTLESGEIEAVYARGQQVVYPSISWKYQKFLGDGAEDTFDLDFDIRENTQSVYLDGIFKEHGVDYNIVSGNQIVFTTPPVTDVVIEVKYVEA